MGLFVDKKQTGILSVSAPESDHKWLQIRNRIWLGITCSFISEVDLTEAKTMCRTPISSF